MPKVSLTPAQKRDEWFDAFGSIVSRYVNRHDKAVPFRSYGELADAAEVSRQTISQVMNGHKMPGLGTFARIASECNMDEKEVGWLVLKLGAIK